MENKNQTQQVAMLPVISLKEWLWTMLLLVLPVVNIVAILYFAFAGDVHQTKKNWARAGLIFAVIIAVIGFLFSIVSALLFASAVENIDFSDFESEFNAEEFAAAMESLEASFEGLELEVE